ncbi:CRAL-TRIO domain-containing protein, partial [Cyathus striatus]
MPSSTPSHEEILANFRKELYDEEILHDGDTIGTDDAVLLRFLRARTFDLVQAKKMFRECQEWRKTVEGVGIDELYKQMDPFDYPEREAVFECWPMWFHKTDKRGRPINIQNLGSLDLTKLYKGCTPERHWTSVLVNAESLVREVIPAAVRVSGKPIGQSLVIVDIKGFGFSKFWQMKNLAQQSFKVSQDYYPETMGQLVVINAPTSFTAIWNVVKMWLSKETIAKVDIVGTDYEEKLLGMVDRANLPRLLGGECTCEEAGGCHLSGAGPWLE